MDEALALPTEDAARVALRTLQVIAHESGVADTFDPLAGSYAIEELTSEIERRAVDYLDKIDAIGGTLHAIESGYIQREIQNAAYEYQLALEADDAIVVGVNRFQNEGDSHVKTLRVDPAVEKAQIDRLRSLRARRDPIACETSLVQLEEAQLKIDEGYLPQQLDAAGVEQAIQAAMAETGAQGPRDQGKVMGLLSSRLRGRADMKAVASTVQAKLATAG